MFQLQFVDKTLPLAAGDVEAISGATITTAVSYTHLDVYKRQWPSRTAAF